MFPAHAAVLPNHQLPVLGNTQTDQTQTIPNLNPNAAQVAARVNTVAVDSFLKGIESKPLLLSNHNQNANALQGSAYELLQQAKTSILLISFTFSDPKALELLNQKAEEGVEIQLVVDKAHLPNAAQLHPSIKLTTRRIGEGHLHHKALVIDHSYVWLGSANFTSSAFNKIKNLAIGCLSKPFADAIHEEAAHIESQTVRTGMNPISYKYGNQSLELYILPHNNPLAPEASAAAWNNQGKERLMSLIEEAQQDIKISVDNWTLKEASQALIAAHQRGVNVEVVTNHLEEEAIILLIQNGIPVKQGDQLHHKFMLVDNKNLLNGSPNWTMNMLSRSDESFFVLYDLTSEQQSVMHEVLQAAGLSIPHVKINSQAKLSNAPAHPMKKLWNFILQLKCTSGLPFLIAAQAKGKEDLKGKEALVNRTIAALNREIKNFPSDKEGVRLANMASRLSAKLSELIPKLKNLPVPGCCYYKGKDYLKNVVAIAEKQKRIERAISYLKTTTTNNIEVDKYFQNVFLRLKEGENVPLPDLFCYLEDPEMAICNHTLFQPIDLECQPYQFHNSEESMFAVDAGCLAGTQGSVIQHESKHLVRGYWKWERQLEMKTLDNISIKNENIAFIVGPQQQSISKIKSLVDKNKLNIPVLDPATAFQIGGILWQVGRFELPSFNWMNYSSFLPQGVYRRSEKGTF